MLDLENSIEGVLIPHDATLSDVIVNLNASGVKLAICVDSDRRLLGTVSDGDLRRGLLAGLSMGDSVQGVLNSNPVVVSEADDIASVRTLMKANKVSQIPVLNEDSLVVGLHLWDDIDSETVKDNLMVIMAGGRGTRLRPYTDQCPKPMLLVDDKPMLQHIIERAVNQGFTRFIISLNYMGNLIRDYFGNGESMGVSIDYLQEESPLGTAGALSLITEFPKSMFIVTNGDVMTDVDYSRLLEFGMRQEADGVMAVRSHEIQNPFGVVEVSGLDIKGFTEKPVTRSMINAGVYAINPSALRLMSANQYCDMPSLFDLMRQAGMRTIAFPMHETWLDVGRPEDLRYARELSNG